MNFTPSSAARIMRTRFSRRRKIAMALAAGLLVAIFFVGRPLAHLASVKWRDVDDRESLPAGYLDDASRMNATEVAEIWPVPKNKADAERELAELLRRAAKDGRRVSIAGARHTMGGHTIYPDGVVIDMLPFREMSLDASKSILTVQAGARWADVIAYLDAEGRSVGVMQSNNSFTVGGSLSCNCHGWPYAKPPIASTVESFRLMLADGKIVRCSRTENGELFSLALGGYGLFGVILDAELRVVPNERYRLEQFIVPAAEALSAFDAHIRNSSDVAMAYGRLGITPSRFLEEAIINVFHRNPAPDGSMPTLRSPESIQLRRSLFRGSIGSEYGKELRWNAEVRLQPHLTDEYFSRNQLLNESVDTFQNRSRASTDILHEYFVPSDGLARFIRAVQEIVPRRGGDLLNVTVRYVLPDNDSFLRYADQEMFAFVMLFNQPSTAAGDAAMQAMTRDLIDASLRCGGRYYLPYRLHATAGQFLQAYPQAPEFFGLKRKYDPRELFQNEFYLKYGELGADKTAKSP
jgi:FAD/FMN-containing dehydrogenase